MGILYNIFTLKVMKGKWKEKIKTWILYHILYPKNDEHKIEGTNENWDFLKLHFHTPKNDERKI